MKYVVVKDDVFSEVLGIFDSEKNASDAADWTDGKVKLVPEFDDGFPMCYKGVGFKEVTVEKKEKKIKGKPVVNVTPTNNGIGGTEVVVSICVDRESRWLTKYVLDVNYAFERGSELARNVKESVSLILEECTQILMSKVQKFDRAEKVVLEAEAEIARFLCSKYMN